jgi:hypothetical protein
MIVIAQIGQNLAGKGSDQSHDQPFLCGEVLKKVHDPTKLGVRTTGPYTIKCVHVNGTITLQLRPGFTERINIRRLVL